MVGAAEFSFGWMSSSAAGVALAVLGVVGGIVLLFILAWVCYRAWRRSKAVAPSGAQEFEKAEPSAEPGLTGRAREFLDSDQAREDALGWPAAEASGAVVSAERQDAEGSTATAVATKTILVAEDDPVVAFALKRRLEKLGFQVLRSPDSAHALLGAMKLQPDLVILDVNMPGGNGLAVCEMMASDPQYADIPVIVHTSRAEAATKERCKQLGAQYVEKSPTSWEQIVALVTRLIGESGGETETPPPEPSEAAPQLDSPVCGRPRVVCIDGPRGELESVQHRLLGQGAEVTRTQDLEEGFWTCFTEKPHVVVIQTEERGKKFFEALYRFTQHPVTRELPVFLVLDKPLTAKEAKEVPEGRNLKVLEASMGVEGVLAELETLIPIVDTEDAVPVARPPDPKAQADRVDPQTLAEGEAPGKPLRILCIDDDPMIAKSIGLRVKPYGIEVLDAAAGTEGFFLGLRELPDLILLDLHMPDGGGNYILSRFKNHPRTKDIPIVILTVETNPGVERGLISGGAVGFLSKPVRWNRFFAELQRHVPLPRRLIVDYKLAEETD